MRGEVDFVGPRGSRVRRSPALVGPGILPFLRPLSAPAASSPAGIGRTLRWARGRRVAHKVNPSSLNGSLPRQASAWPAPAGGAVPRAGHLLTLGGFLGGGTTPPNALPVPPPS